MQILVLTGSPHKEGTSNYLAEEFIRGARESGNDVIHIDVAHKDIKGCQGCNYCRSHKDNCFMKDGMDEIKETILKADMVVLVTPLYFFGFSAQIKTAIDRLYVVNPILQSQDKYMMLFATCNDMEESKVEPLISHYHALINNFGWKNAGVVIAQGYNDRESIRHTQYGNKVYKIGKSLTDTYTLG